MTSGNASASADPTRRFLRRIVAVLAAAAILAFGGAYWRTHTLIDSQALESARSDVDFIVAARSWNALHGGVWVVKGPGTVTNRYLAEMGVSADATATDGRLFTLRNPALMTVEISQILSRGGRATLHLTSLRPVNPANAPDAWERASLASFDRGVTETSITTEESGTAVLRYMRPLVTDSTCLTCHAGQGYRVGDIRGAISVTLPLARQTRDTALNAALIAGVGAAATALLLLSTLGLVRALRRQLDAAQSALVEAATTDELTRLASRRHTMERLREEIERARRTGRPLAIVMADIDDFKAVNDSRGHAAGDRVLKDVAARMAGALRPYDLLGRIGGEEFLIIAPDADLDGAVAIAERARVLVAQDRPGGAADAACVTASFGVTLVDPEEPAALDRSLARADSALYASKAAGRDRVTVSLRETR